MRDKLSIREYFEKQVEAGLASLRKLNDDYVMAVDASALADHLASESFPSEVQEDVEQQPTIERVRVERPHYRDPSLMVEVTEVVVTVHLVEHPSVSVLFGLEPSTSSLASPRYDYSRGKLQCRCTVDAPTISRAVADMRNEIQWRNEDIRTFSVEFHRRLVDGVRQRQERLRREQIAFGAVVRELVTIQVVNRGSEGLSPPPVRIKEVFRRVLKPIVADGKPTALPDDVHAAIMELIQNICAFFERAPASFSTRSETELRDIILAVLNSVFEGQASGETFNKSGKTDVSLPVGDGSIFVGECKLWTGPATVGATTDQLLSYLRWHDTKAVCLIFSDRLDFSNVVQAHQAAAEQLPTLSGTVRRITPAHLRSVHAKQTDLGTKFTIDHLLVDLSTHRPGGRN